MASYGYARVSSEDQDLTIQIETLKAAGCDIVRGEKATGTTREGRRELELLLQFLRPGDELVVTRFDRLARSMKDLQDLVHELTGRNISLRATEQPVDTSTPTGKAFLSMLGVFAEFETALRRERQLEGIKKAKAAGAYKGSKHRLPVAEIRRLRGTGMGATAIARTLKVGRASVYRVLTTT